MTQIRIVHCNERPYDVLICRGTPYGNPFTHKKGNTLAKWVVKSRKESIECFRTWLLTSDDPEAKWIREHMHELRGKVLGCYCKSEHNPKDCHGEVYAELVDPSPFEDFFS